MTRTELPWLLVGTEAEQPRQKPPRVLIIGAVISASRGNASFPDSASSGRDGEGTIDVKGILAAMPPGIPYALEIPRVTLTHAVGPYEVARLAVMACRAELDGERWQPAAAQAATAGRGAKPARVSA